MVAHRDFESDCKRIAKVIQEEANDPIGDAVCFGSVCVDISRKLACYLDKLIRENKKKFNKEFEKEINKHLKGCKVEWNRIENNCIFFTIEFDDVDPEFEDW